MLIQLFLFSSAIAEEKQPNSVSTFLFNITITILYYTANVMLCFSSICFVYVDAWVVQIS